MAGASFHFQIINGVAILDVEGSLDAHTTPEFDKKMKEIMGQTKKVLLNVSKMVYIATSGLGALMAAKSLGAIVVLAGMNDNVKKVFSAMGFNKVFKIFPSIELARDSFSS